MSPSKIALPVAFLPGCVEMIDKLGNGLGPEEGEHGQVFLGSRVVLDEGRCLGTAMNPVPHENLVVVGKRALHARELLPSLPVEVRLKTFHKQGLIEVGHDVSYGRAADGRTKRETASAD